MIGPATKMSAIDAHAYRISPRDSNYFALLFDPESAGCEQIAVIEIFTVGGRTPPNTHRYAHEFFYVLSGEAVASCAGADTRLRKGDALMVRPGTEHVIANVGDAKLYTLTFMCPDEAFAALIRAGERVELDDEDRKILGAA